MKEKTLLEKRYLWWGGGKKGEIQFVWGKGGAEGLTVVESRAHVGNDPENEPQTGPRLADEHGDVFAGQTESEHAHVV